MTLLAQLPCGCNGEDPCEEHAAGLDTAARRPHTPAPTASEERWLADRIGLPWHELYAGVTDTDTRRLRICTRIVALGLEDAPAGKRDGVVETYRELVQRLWGMPLGEAP